MTSWRWVRKKKYIFCCSLIKFWVFGTKWPEICVAASAMHARKQWLCPNSVEPMTMLQDFLVTPSWQHTHGPVTHLEAYTITSRLIHLLLSALIHSLCTPGLITLPEKCLSVQVMSTTQHKHSTPREDVCPFGWPSVDSPNDGSTPETSKLFKGRPGNVTHQLLAQITSTIINKSYWWWV